VQAAADKKQIKVCVNQMRNSMDDEENNADWICYMRGNKK